MFRFQVVCGMCQSQRAHAESDDKQVTQTRRHAQRESASRQAFAVGGSIVVGSVTLEFWMRKCEIERYGFRAPENSAASACHVVSARFRVELYALYWITPVPQPHDHLLATVTCLRAHFQFIRQIMRRD